MKGLARQLRRIQHDLRPAHIDLGLSYSVEMFCAAYQAAHADVKLDVQMDFAEKDIPASLRIALFRLVQESLNNIAKHSKATRATVSVVRTREELIASIRDDGTGFVVRGTETGAGLGLRTMRERVELSGGIFTLQTASGEGVTLTAEWGKEALLLYDNAHFVSA